MNHGPKSEAFLWFDNRNPPRDVDSTSADKDLVQVDVTQETDCALTDERKGSGPLHESAGHERLQSFAVAQLHGDVDGVGYDAKVAPIADVASDLGCCGAGGKPDRIVFLNELGASQADPPLFG